MGTGRVEFAKPLYGLTPVPRVRIRPSRHAVWIAEKLGCGAVKSAEIAQNFPTFAGNPDQRKRSSQLHAQTLLPFSL
jgi:hypothetical protein